MFRSSVVAAALIAVAVAGCDKKVSSIPQPRPVRTVTVERHAEGEAVSLTGAVRAKDQANLAFRLDGRMLERPVTVGDVLKPGQVVVRLDPQNQQNSLRSAQANLTSDEAVLTEVTKTLWRQHELLDKGWTSRSTFDKAQQAFLSAKAAVDSAQAQVRIAKSS